MAQHLAIDCAGEQIRFSFCGIPPRSSTLFFQVLEKEKAKPQPVSLLAMRDPNPVNRESDHIQVSCRRLYFLLNYAIIRGSNRAIADSIIYGILC